MSKIAIKFIELYQIYLSPLLYRKGVRCRFHPTCSDYAIISYQKYGFIEGTYKTIKRLFRCRPKNLNSCIDLP